MFWVRTEIAFSELLFGGRIDAAAAARSDGDFRAQHNQRDNDASDCAVGRVNAATRSLGTL